MEALPRAYAHAGSVRQGRPPPPRFERVGGTPQPVVAGVVRVHACKYAHMCQSYGMRMRDSRVYQHLEGVIEQHWACAASREFVWSWAASKRRPRWLMPVIDVTERPPGSTRCGAPRLFSRRASEDTAVSRVEEVLVGRKLADGCWLIGWLMAGWAGGWRLGDVLEVGRKLADGCAWAPSARDHRRHKGVTRWHKAIALASGATG